MNMNYRLLIAGLLLVGCNDGPTAVGTVFEDAGATDLGVPADRGGPVDTGATVDAPVATDTPVATDNGEVDSGVPTDDGVVDAGLPLDTGAVDTGVIDTGVVDTGVVDTGVVDAGVVDTGVVAMDTGVDAGVTDTGPRDTGAVDAGAADVGCVPATETCNGRDDDCDGVIDESGCATHLLITEVVTGPSDAEYVEIFNPTAAAVDLSDVYISDSRDYACYLGRACTITGRGTDSIGGSDFIARFPAGATLAAGAYAVLAVTRDPAAFVGLTGVCPTFHLPNNGSDAGVGPCTASLPMRTTAHTGSVTIGGSVGLTNGGEPITLFQWDGTAPLVTDLDYVFWGTATAEGQVDKSATVITLPAGGGTAMYRPDTAPASQQRVLVPSSGNAAVRRCDYSEGAQVRTGGNGTGGNDETSERFTATWRGAAGAPTGDAGLGALSATPGAINNCR